MRAACCWNLLPPGAAGGGAPLPPVLLGGSGSSGEMCQASMPLSITSSTSSAAAHWRGSLYIALVFRLGRARWPVDITSHEGSALIPRSKDCSVGGIRAAGKVLPPDKGGPSGLVELEWRDGEKGA